MVENPELGRQYWIVTDFGERFYPVPVVIVAANEKYSAFLARWETGEGRDFEQCQGVLPDELYETPADAEAECHRRNALPCGHVEKAVNDLEE